MKDNSSSFPYRFTNFEFEPRGPLLAFKSELIKEVDKKTLEVLSPLVTAQGSVVTHDEIITAVWKDNYHGVTPARVNQYVSKLQKLLQRYEPETKFVENIRGRGYRFIIDVEKRVDPDSADAVPKQAPAATPARYSDEEGGSKSFPPRSRVRSMLLLTGAIASALLLVAWLWYPIDDEKEIRRVVEESQKYESMVMYRDPANLDESRIISFWLPEEEFGAEVDIKRIRAGAERLSREGKRYGPESKVEQFEFQFVEINKERNFATAKTLERWFIAEYLEDGSLFRNKTVGPYFVHYILRKVSGKWLVEKSTTARVIPPSPIIDSIAPPTDIAGGRQSFFSIIGKNFVPDIVAIKVIGPGCPEANPCTVPNGALRQHAQLQEQSISNIPVTLASGKFTILVHNGESPVSNALTLTVP